MLIQNWRRLEVEAEGGKPDVKVWRLSIESYSLWFEFACFIFGLDAFSTLKNLSLPKIVVTPQQLNYFLRLNLALRVLQ